MNKSIKNPAILLLRKGKQIKISVCRLSIIYLKSIEITCAAWIHWLWCKPEMNSFEIVIRFIQLKKVNYISRAIIRIPCVVPWNNVIESIKTMDWTSHISLFYCTVFHLHARNFALYVGTDDSRSDFRASSANFRMQCNLQTSLFSSFKYRYQFLHTNEQFLKSRKSRYENITSRIWSGNREAIPSVMLYFVKETMRKTEEPDKISSFFVSSWEKIIAAQPRFHIQQNIDVSYLTYFNAIIIQGWHSRSQLNLAAHIN